MLDYGNPHHYSAPMNLPIELTKPGLARREFLRACALGLAGVAARPLAVLGAELATPSPRPLPLKLGIRAATMGMVGDLSVIQTAAGIQGIRGVELQVTAGARNLRDRDIVRQYKRESDRWDVRIPSLAGIWDKGVSITSPGAGECLQTAIRAAELLGSGVVLVAFFKENAPDMSREESYNQVLTTLRKAAGTAADAGVVLGLETSLSPTDNVKLVDMIGYPAVRIYYDLYNMASFGHGAEAVAGVKLFGRERICAVHVKNGDKLIEEPGPIDWPAAFDAFNEIGYDGWFTYETAHKNTAACLADTVRNNAFLSKHLHRPIASK
jgi:sugar phosphate isomerase/epimerase